MRFDIRLPIGLLFLALGLLLVWLPPDQRSPALYREHSLGVNINLVWGSVMAVFGLAMLGLTLLRARWPDPH